MLHDVGYDMMEAYDLFSCLPDLGLYIYTQDRKLPIRMLLRIARDIAATVKLGLISNLTRCNYLQFRKNVLNKSYRFIFYLSCMYEFLHIIFQCVFTLSETKHKAITQHSIHDLSFSQYNYFSSLQDYIEVY